MVCSELTVTKYLIILRNSFVLSINMLDVEVYQDRIALQMRIDKAFRNMPMIQLLMHYSSGVSRKICNYEAVSCLMEKDLAPKVPPRCRVSLGEKFFPL